MHLVLSENLPVLKIYRQLAQEVADKRGMMMAEEDDEHDSLLLLLRSKQYVYISKCEV